MEPWRVTTAQRCRHSFVVKNYHTFYTRFTSCVPLFLVICSPTKKIVNPICRTNFIYWCPKSILRILWYKSALPTQVISSLMSKEELPAHSSCISCAKLLFYEYQLLGLFFIYRLFFSSSHQYLRINFKKWEFIS